MRSFAIGGILGVVWIFVSLTAYHRLFQESQAAQRAKGKHEASLLVDAGGGNRSGLGPASQEPERNPSQGAMSDASVHPKRALKQRIEPPLESVAPAPAAPSVGLRRKGVAVHSNGLSVWEAGVAWLSSPQGIRARPGSLELRIEDGAGQLLEQVAARMTADTALGLIIVSRFAVEEQNASIEGGDAGLARGDALRGALFALGVMPNRCAVVSQLDQQGFAEGETPMDLILVSKREALRSWSASRSNAGEGLGSTFSFVEHIRFPYGSSKLPEDQITLAPFRLLADQLNQEPDLTVELTGHTCAISSAGFNERLGLARAQSLADWLKSQGIAADRIAVRSAGEGQPLADNATETGQAANRRVEVRIR